MIVVAIIGILAALAVPAYKDYAMRAKVSEGLTLATSAKLGVAEYLQSTGSWPVSNAQAGLAAGSAIRGHYAGSVWVGTDGTSGLVAISYNNPADIAGKSIVLVANATGGAINWTCTGGTLPARFRPSVCRL